MTHLATAKNIKTCLLKEIGNRMDFVITKSVLDQFLFQFRYFKFHANRAILRRLKICLQLITKSQKIGEIEKLVNAIYSFSDFLPILPVGQVVISLEKYPIVPHFYEYCLVVST